MIKLNGHIVTPTIFPDKTSQVWKVTGMSPVSNIIDWLFESEAEVMHILQLADLINSYHPGSGVIKVNSLPYSRQDKNISNDSTFALHSFLRVLDLTKMRIVTVDVHNPNSINNHWIVNLSPEERIKEVINEIKPTVVAFPDSGALGRYAHIPGGDIWKVAFNKVRDQSTGEIKGMFCTRPEHVAAGSRVLLVDDICDGGKTFIECSKAIYKLGAYGVDLYTTHGLYTKGVEVLREAGINRIFNYNGEVE